MLQAVLQGRGFAQLAGYQVCELLREGRLVACMPEYAPDDRGHYICYLSRLHLPSRIRAFVDYMISAIRAMELQCADLFPAYPDAKLIETGQVVAAGDES